MIQTDESILPITDQAARQLAGEIVRELYTNNEGTGGQWAIIVQADGTWTGRAWNVATVGDVIAARIITTLEQEDLAEGEGDRLRRAAQEWIAYYDRHGAREFNRRFGTREVHGDEFIKFLREFLAGEEPAGASDVGN